MGFFNSTAEKERPKCDFSCPQRQQAVQNVKFHIHSENKLAIMWLSRSPKNFLLTNNVLQIVVPCKL